MDPVDTSGSEIVEGELSAESTERQAAPARRSTPVMVPARGRPERSRRSTLASPIPALLAASMRVPGPPASGPPAVPADAIPRPAGQAQTTRITAPTRSRSPLEGDADYVVEIEAAKQNP
jgi:hypothetical protein